MLRTLRYLATRGTRMFWERYIDYIKADDEDMADILNIQREMVNKLLFVFNGYISGKVSNDKLISAYLDAIESYGTMQVLAGGLIIAITDEIRDELKPINDDLTTLINIHQDQNKIQKAIQELTQQGA